MNKSFYFNIVVCSSFPFFPLPYPKIRFLVFTHVICKYSTAEGLKPPCPDHKELFGVASSWWRTEHSMFLSSYKSYRNGSGEEEKGMKGGCGARCQWLPPVILATQRSGGSQFEASPGK
jgi:hypothetical protein